MMRALWRGRAKDDHLSDALTVLAGWQREDRLLHRTLLLDDAQHSALAERVKVAADSLNLLAEVRRREGETQIRVGCCDGDAITDREVALAARIETAYRTVTGAEPIDALWADGGPGR